MEQTGSLQRVFNLGETFGGQKTLSEIIDGARRYLRRTLMIDEVSSREAFALRRHAERTAEIFDAGLKAGNYLKFHPSIESVYALMEELYGVTVKEINLLRRGMYDEEHMTLLLKIEDMRDAANYPQGLNVRPVLDRIAREKGACLEY